MRTTLLTAAALGLALLVPVAAPADDKPTGDLAKLQGKWTAQIAHEDQKIDIVIVIEGKNCTGKANIPGSGEFEVKGQIAVTDSAKPHKTIDWTGFKGPSGEDVPDNHGIYVFEDDKTLKVCNGGPGKDRPTEFKAGEGEGGPQLFTLKREAAAKADTTEVKGDLAKLQGDWTAKVGPEHNIDVSIAFKASKLSLTFTRDGEERTMKGDVVLDEAAKPHKTITFKNFTRPDGTDAPENLGIYVLVDANTVKICSGGPGNERPTEFKAGDGGPPQLIELKRKK
jgi:uncharacterized protein (TIGR03067 family)